MLVVAASCYGHASLNFLASLEENMLEAVEDLKLVQSPNYGNALSKQTCVKIVLSISRPKSNLTAGARLKH